MVKNLGLLIGSLVLAASLAGCEIKVLGPIEGPIYPETFTLRNNQNYLGDKPRAKRKTLTASQLQEEYKLLTKEQKQEMISEMIKGYAAAVMP